MVLMYIMENEYYKQTEIKFFGNIFDYLRNGARCDLSGNVLVCDVHNFLSSSFNLSEDIVNQIGSVTGSAIQGSYGEKELFFALKLVSAAQQGLPISQNTLLLHTDLPLPNLLTNNNVQFENGRIDQIGDSQEASSPDLIQLSDSDCPAFKRNCGGDGGYHIMISEDDIDDRAREDVNCDLMGNLASHSPSVSSLGSESPTPTNSVHEKNWNKSHNSQWQSLVNEEHCQLLGTEEDSSDRHSSEEEDSDVWTMTDEQQHYYSEQFMTMQSDLTGILPGSIAKEFFEKSKLPINELSKIWQLSDVTRDGALSLEEFYAAMHLVVLRRNNIPLPDILPASLMPKSLKNLSMSGSDCVSDSVVSCKAIGTELQRVRQSSSDHSTQDGKEPPAGDQLSPAKNKEWAKFLDSPTSNLSSPGPKPVNFDFHKSAVEKDPMILHPKPLRLTPESKKLEKADGDCSFSSQDAETDVLPRSGHSLRPSACVSPNVIETVDALIKPHGSLTRSMSPSAIQASLSIQEEEENNELGGPPSLPLMGHGGGPLKKDPPPPPPPRPTKAHVRSSSLDLNKFSKTSHHGGPPLVPPRSSPLTGSPQRQVLPAAADDSGDCSAWESRLSNVSEDLAIPNPLRNSGTEQSHLSAFEVYKKPQDDTASEAIKTTSSEEEEKPPPSFSIRQKDKRELLTSLHTYREKNTVLSRVNSELNQELAEVIEERIALEFQLEQMKPFSN